MEKMQYGQACNVDKPIRSCHFLPRELTTHAMSTSEEHNRRTEETENSSMFNLSSFQWFIDHPILSTTLWLIGKGATPDESDFHMIDANLEASSNSRGRLSWSDEHGQSLTEILGAEVMIVLLLVEMWSENISNSGIFWSLHQLQHLVQTVRKL